MALWVQVEITRKGVLKGLLLWRAFVHNIRKFVAVVLVCGGRYAIVDNDFGSSLVLT